MKKWFEKIYHYFFLLLNLIFQLPQHRVACEGTRKMLDWILHNYTHTIIILEVNDAFFMVFFPHKIHLRKKL